MNREKMVFSCLRLYCRRRPGDRRIDRRRQRLRGPALAARGRAGRAVRAGGGLLLHEDASALLPWLQLKPVQGTLLVFAGVLALSIPPQFFVSAVLLALGSRKVWQEACRLADAEQAAESHRHDVGKDGRRYPARQAGAAGNGRHPVGRHRHAAYHADRLGGTGARLSVGGRHGPAGIPGRAFPLPAEACRRCRGGR